MRQHWLRFHKHIERPTKLSPSSPLRLVPSAAFDELRDRLREYKRVKLDREALPEVADRFDEYLLRDTTPHSAAFDPISFRLYRRRTTPQLANFVLDCLNIPPMSDECERSFSSGRDLLQYKRSRLLSDVIKACTGLRIWYFQPTPQEVRTDKLNEHGKEVVYEHV